MRPIGLPQRSLAAAVFLLLPGISIPAASRGLRAPALSSITVTVLDDEEGDTLQARCSVVDAIGT
ncbi:MAG: hypothetical protein PHQ19_07985, partial [Candidatus Krumholzibacteria bacterium]|nr:hypothetical protein [Candidatus Krumholzibacteria bacterium]